MCEEKNNDLIVIKTPVVVSDIAYSKLNDVRRICESQAVVYYDMNIDVADWGFDYAKNMLDALHVNATGGEKVTKR